MPTLQAHGCTVEFKRVGAPAPGRPTLVFLHHGLGCVALWRQFPERLAEATGCPAFVYSQLGHGGSQAAAWPQPIDYLEVEGRDRLPQVLAAAGIDDFILIGHSGGGTMALVYGAEVKTGLRGIIAEAPHVFAEGTTIAQIKRVRAEYPASDLRDRLKRFHGDNVDCAFHGWAETWLQPGFETFSIEKSIGKIEVPVLAILGRQDEYGTQAQLELIVERARCPLETVAPNCGHAPHEEIEQDMLELMARFVQRLQVPAQSG
jgi:pimeloyl-ACP methyl ester carboxylesterase